MARGEGWDESIDSESWRSGTRGGGAAGSSSRSSRWTGHGDHGGGREERLLAPTRGSKVWDRAANRAEGGLRRSALGDRLAGFIPRTLMSSSGVESPRG